MFDSTNPFGQSSTSPFGTSSVFGGSNASNNPLTPKPFGTFGSQTGGSISDGTSTGVFGAAQSSSPLGSTPAFGASSMPTFGSSAFGASSTSSFGGSSILGQKPAIGGFGSTTGQTSPFGSTLQQSQPAFGSCVFGSRTPFGAASTPIFVASSTPAFGASSTAAFAAASTPTSVASSTPFCTAAFAAASTPTSVAFSTPAFGTAASTPTSVSSSTPAFDAASTAAFAAASTPTSVASSTLAFGSAAFAAAKTPTSAKAAKTPTSAKAAKTLTSVSSSTPAFGAFAAATTPTSVASSTPAFGTTDFAAVSIPISVASSTPACSIAVFAAASTPISISSSTPAFGASNTAAFAAASTPASVASSTAAFASASTPTYVASCTPTFGVNTAPTFGSTSTPTFGNTGSVFGSSSTPVFGSSATPALGASSTPVFGSSSVSTFGSSSTPALGASSTPPFGASSTPSCNFGSSPTFGQSSSAFGTTSHGAQSSPFGAQSTTTPTFGYPGFGQFGFGSQRGGSRVAPYAPTAEVDDWTGTLESTSAMPVYKDKSHEELRWEDYQLGDKGGPNTAGQPASGIGFSAPAQSNLFGTTGTFAQTSANPFSSTTSTNPFASKTPTFGSTGFGSSLSPSFSSPFGTSASPFGTTTSSTTPSLFGATTTPAFGASSSPSLFGGSSTPAFGASSSPSIFGSASAPGSSPAFGSGLTFGNTQASGLFQSSTKSTIKQVQTQSTTTTFGNPCFGQSGFGSQRGGSRVAPYAPTAEVDGGCGTQPAGKLESTSAMPVYKDKSHEELRWEDYQLGDNGGPNPASQPASGIGFSAPAQSNLFGTTSTFAQTSANPFSSTTSSPSPSFISPFGTSASPFGTTISSTTPSLFGATTTPAFGASSSPSLFGGSSTPAFSASSSSAFGSGLTFGNTQASGLFQSSSPLGQTASPAFGSGLTFGNTQASGLFQSSTKSTIKQVQTQSPTTTFGNPGFGQSGFGSQRGGSRVAPYASTAEVDGGCGTQPAGKLESTSAMPVYKDKSHEELRWEDYQLGDNGGPNPASQPANGIGFSAPAQSNLFGTTSTFAQTSANPFSSTTSFPSPSFISPFSTSASPFGTTTSSTTPSLFGATTTPAFGASSSPSLFGGSSTPAFGASSSPSIFGSASARGSSPAFGSGLTFGNTQASGLFQSSSPLGQTASPAFGSGLTFGNTHASGLFQSSTPLGQTASGFGSTAPAFGQTTSSTFGQPNPFGTPSTGFWRNLFSSSSTPSLLATSTSIGFGQTMPFLSSPFSAPIQTSGAFSFGNFGQTQSAPSSGFGGVSNNFGQGAFGQSGTIQSYWVPQPVPVSNPFGTLPAMPQMSIGRAGSSPSIQYGISSMPAVLEIHGIQVVIVHVADKPAPVRVSSLLTTRHLSQRRTRLPPRKDHPKTDGPKGKPRAPVIRPIEPWASRASAEKSVLKDVPTPIRDNGKSSGDASVSAVSGSFGDDGHDNCRRPVTESVTRSTWN